MCHVLFILRKINQNNQKTTWMNYLYWFNLVLVLLVNYSMSASIGPGTSVGGGGDGGDPSPPPPGCVNEDGAEDDRPMTYDEKRTLSLGINMLNGPLLGRVIQIIQSLQPSIADDDKNEFEIDFEKLNPAALRALERFVKSKVPYVYEKHL